MTKNMTMMSKTFKLLKNVQKYYCSIMYGFILCLYGVITAAAYFGTGRDMVISCEFALPMLIMASCIMTAVCAYVVYSNAFQMAIAQNVPRRCAMISSLISMVIMALFISGAYSLWLLGIENLLDTNDMTSYETLKANSRIFDFFFTGSAFKSFISAAMVFAIIYLSALLISVVIKRFNIWLGILVVAAYVFLFIKLFSDIGAGNYAESICYRRNMGFVAIAEIVVFFVVACRRMDIKR
ncbi:hypothetical protein [Ruminococcus sp.]|uniref:hypothetical protein n=1 Tax=Ruminococcus sp. TaxID=41978 RepID=UPI0025FDE90C|nr:hypothetical protein [Ruminococcus sp.]